MNNIHKDKPYATSNHEELHSVFKNCDSKDTTQQQIIETLKIFLDRGVDVNLRNSKGITTLHLAVEYRMKVVAEFLIESGADVDARDSRNFSISYVLIERVIEEFEKLALFPDKLEYEESKIVSFMDWMVSKKFNFNFSCNSGLSLLHLIIQNNLHNIANTLLRYTGTNNQMLHIYLETYQDILDKRFQAFYDYKYYKKQYSLNIFKSIVNKGFSVNILNANLETVFHVAIKMRLGIDMLQTLISRFTALNSTDTDGKTVLHRMVENYEESKWESEGYMQILRWLIFKGADISRQDLNGVTVLQRTVMNGDLDAFLAMRDLGVNFDAETPEGKNLPHLVSNNGSIIEYLVNEGDDIDGVDDNGYTSLHMSVNQSDACKLLLKFGEYVNAGDNKGLRPLHAALAEEKNDVSEYSLRYGVDINNFETINAILSSRDTDAVFWTLEYITKSSYAGTPYTGEYDNIITHYRGYRDECQQEVQFMKQFPIDHNTSLFDFLECNLHRKCFYVHNERLKNLVNDKEVLKKKLPNYFIMIMNSYHQAVTRKKLLPLAELAWYHLTAITLPSICLDRIFMELNNHELAIICEENYQVIQKPKHSMTGSPEASKIGN